MDYAADNVAIRRAARRKRANRKYGGAHAKLRAALAPAVATGTVSCVRCGELITGAWDLGHDDFRPWLHSGPEHAACNRGAPQRNKTSRQW